MSDDMPPPLPDDHVCAPHTVPGWLNEAGLPTSCVGDHPCPGFDAETCLVDDNAVPTLPVLEVGLYLYQKVDATAPASFANSGPQDFIAAQPGTAWFTVYPVALPDGVCGPGWAVQQDQISHDGSFVWPSTITPPPTPLSDAGVLVAALHSDLEALAVVPDCVLDVPEVPDVEICLPVEGPGGCNEVSPDPLPLDPLPTPEATVVVPVVPRELALTGPADGVGWDWLVVALLLVGVGFFFTANERKR